MIRIFASFAFLFMITLAGCTNLPRPSSIQPDMTFDNLDTVILRLSSIKIENKYLPPMKPPYVEHIFSTPPYKAIESLLKKRLQAIPETEEEAGRILRVIIKDASVIKEDLPRSKGLRGYFEVPADRFKARVALQFEMVHRDFPNKVLGKAEVVAKRRKVLPKSASIAEQDSAYYQLTEGLMKDLNKGLMTIVKKSFGESNGN